MLSLEDVATKYAIPFTKSLHLGKLLASGIKMEDIPKDDLTAYLIDDVKVLDKIYGNQIRICGDSYYMDYILPLAEMELNGLTLDVPKAQALMTKLVVDVDTEEETIISHMLQCCEWQDGSALTREDFTPEEGIKSKCIKPMANRTLSFLLTGNPAEIKITNKATHLGYPIGESILGELTDWISKVALRHRTANKLLGTYISPFLHSASVQGTVHPTLNTAVTGTGRLSSSAPNGQNIPGIARELFLPNAVLPNASMVEIDFKQLEILAVACVSGDKVLIQDLLDGVDVHYQSGKSVFGWKTEADMTEKDRKVVKGVNFGLLYGGKAGGLAKQTGVSKKIVQKLIDSFYKRYPRVAAWQTEVFTEVCDKLQVWTILDGEQAYESKYTDPFSGRTWLFREKRSPPWLRAKTGRKFSFSPMQTSNYPIQGFAGGDIVMTALTELWKRLRGEVRFVMTVHDSIVLEAEDVAKVEAAMKMACFETEQKFKIPVRLGFDLETGSHWS
jgi:DNA polymerase I-like protein with 3'-5' exonuclease and polymerase domains